VRHKSKPPSDNSLTQKGLSCAYSNDFEKNSRGALIDVNSCLCSSLVNIETKFNENIFIRINFDIVIGNIYRSPSSKGDNDDELCKLISYISYDK